MTSKYIILLIILTFITTLSSITWTENTVYTQKDLEDMRYGWPVSFITQNQNRYTPVYFPQDFDVDIPQEAPIRIFYLRLLFNFGIHFLALTGLCNMLFGVYRSFKK